MKKVFEFVKSYDLVTKKGVNSKRISNLTEAKIIGFAEKISAKIESSVVPIAKSSFTHTASTSLGGGTQGCFHLNCRLSKLDQLARFALLYSDGVFIENYFLGYKPFYKNGVSLDSQFELNMMKYKFGADLYLLKYIQPLLEKGIISFAPTKFHFCKGCFAEFNERNKLNRKILSDRVKTLSNDYLEKMTISCKKKDGVYSIKIDAPKLNFEHAKFQIAEQLPAQIEKKPRIAQKIKNGKEVFLSKSLSKELGYHNKLARDVLYEINNDLMMAFVYGTAFLTNSEVHFSTLQTIQDNDSVRKNNIVLKHLTSMVPFVEELDIKNILKLRSREKDSFVNFRATLSKVINETRQSQSSFTERNAREIYDEILKPELNRLEKKIKRAKRDLISQTARSLVASVGAISFGFYTGFLPELSMLAKAAGIVLAKDVIQKTMATGDSDASIENEDLYFLWRMGKISKTK